MQAARQEARVMSQSYRSDLTDEQWEVIQTQGYAPKYGAANLPERAGAKLVFAQVKQERSKFWRLVKIWVDGGYIGEEFMRWVMDKYRWILETVLRSNKEKGFKILPRRWVVERTFGWCSAHRRRSS